MRNYLRLIIRNFVDVLRRSRSAALLNIAGLSVAFAVFTVILIRVSQEYSYNTCFRNADRIYRLEFWYEGYDAGVPLPMAGMISRSVPELSKVGVIQYYGSEAEFTLQGEDGERLFYKEEVAYADTGIVEIFDIPIVAGDAHVALTEKHRLLLPLRIARKWFGNENAVGKNVRCRDVEMTVAAVYQDLPENSSIKNKVYSYDFNSGLQMNNWNYVQFYEISPGTDVQALGRKILTVPEFKEEFRRKYDEVRKAGKELVQFRPLKEIYFTEEGGNTDGGNRAFTLLLLVVGGLILSVALVNFVNFSIALSPVRMQALNTQRTFGASRTFLRLCIVSEAVLFSFLAFVIGLLYCYFLNTTGLSDLIKVSVYPAKHIGICFLVAGISILTGLLAGIYPAFYMTAFSPALVLKGSRALSPHGVYLRKTLMVFQFVVSLGLLISVIFIYKQLNMMKMRGWGIDKDNVVYLKTNKELSSQRSAFFTELRRAPFIRNITYASSRFGEESSMDSWNSAAWIGENKTWLTVRMEFVAPNFLSFWGIRIKEGEGFKDTTSYRALVNETFMKEYGLKDPFSVNYSGHRVKGVMYDFNYFTAQYAIQPLILSVMENRSDVYYYIRIEPSAREETLNYIRENIQHFAHSHSGEILFLDDRLQMMYEEESRMGWLISLFGGVTILIALMGVYGLVLFNTRFRAKEIGIRKVNGATISEIVRMLNGESLRLIWVAFIIACPVAWFFMNYYLQNFAYRTGLSAWVFLLSGIIMLLIVVLTTVWQSWKAANANPVDVLKNE